MPLVQVELLVFNTAFIIVGIYLAMVATIYIIAWVTDRITGKKFERFR